ncbi:MAG TPA: hypothetical protein VI793_14475 [Anaerolineales bacterium]|nr:hypothetical protein [Anaerolineales bacterium]
MSFFATACPPDDHQGIIGKGPQQGFRRRQRGAALSGAQARQALALFGRPAPHLQFEQSRQQHR